MSKTKTELQNRNSRSYNRKQGFEDIHIVAKQLVPCVVDLENFDFLKREKNISKTYQNLIEYGEIILNLLANDYEKCLSKFENISPETPLVKIIYDLEEQVSGPYVEVNYDDYETNKSIVVKEWVDVFNSSLYSFDFGIIYSDINENLKIGILKCFQKILDHFGFYYVLNEEFINKIPMDLEGEIDYLKEDEHYENKQKLFDKDFKNSFKKINKTLKDLKKILKKKFNKNSKYENESLQNLHNSICYILDFDMNMIYALREEEDNYNDVFSFENMFVPSFKVDDFSVKLFEFMEQSRLEEMNSFGVELLCTYHTVTKDTFKTHAEESIHDIKVFEENLNEIMHYINNI